MTSEHPQTIKIETFTPAFRTGEEQLPLAEFMHPNRVSRILGAYALIAEHVDRYPAQVVDNRAAVLHENFETNSIANRKLIVASDTEGRVVGGAEVVEARNMTYDEIESIATMPQVRGKGVGSLLLNEIERQAQSDNKERVILEAAGYEGLHDWYEGRGYTPLESASTTSHFRSYEKYLNKK